MSVRDRVPGHAGVAPPRRLRPVRPPARRGGQRTPAAGRCGPSAGPCRPRRARRAPLPADHARRRTALRGAARGRARPGMPLVGDRPPGGHADDQLSLPGADPGGTSLAQRVRASTSRRRPTATTSCSSPASIRRTGRPTGSSIRSSRSGSRTATPRTTRGRRLDLPWPCRASPVVGRAARIRPWRDGRVLRRRSRRASRRTSIT